MSIFDSIAREGLRFSADTFCSEPFQAAAAQSISERYGEEQARLFRTHMYQATAFCRSGAVERVAAMRKAEERRKTYWALGLTAAAVGGLLLWFKLGKKGNRRRSFRRNGAVKYEVGISSQHRYRASASERRLHGGNTVTEFLIEDPNKEGAARWTKQMGYGPTPGERRTDALRRYAAKVGVAAVVGKLRPRSFLETKGSQ